MNNDSAMHANDLTQLSSREQLSALMDDALPPDETRFLLRRLRHDASLAECWERWRLTGDVMRGLAPAQRLPADFANRVATALHGDTIAPRQADRVRTPAWLRWGGGAAMAASLAVAALLLRQPAIDTASEPAAAIATAQVPAAVLPAGPQAPTANASDAQQTIAAASALAAVARPVRASRRSAQAGQAVRPQTASIRSIDRAPSQLASAADAAPLMPQPDIATRPWPRSVLPQYASDGLTVGFGDQARVALSYNPFQVQAVGGTSPANAVSSKQPAPEPDTADADQQAGAPSRP